MLVSQTSHPHDHRLCDLLTPLTQVAIEYLHHLGMHRRVETKKFHIRITLHMNYYRQLTNNETMSHCYLLSAQRVYILEERRVYLY